MKKLCIVVASNMTVKSFMMKHIEYLSRAFDVTVIADEIINNHSLDFKTKIIVINRKINFLDDIKSAYKLYRYMKNEQFDVILSVTPKAGLLAMLTAYLSRSKIRIHFFTGQVWVTQKGLFRLFLKSMDKAIVKMSTHILVDSHSQRKFLISERILTDKNSNTLKQGSISGVNINKFKLDLSVRNQLRNKYNIKNEIVFMFLGRLNEDKGILDLAYVFNILLKKYQKKIKLFLVGPVEQDIERQIISLLKDKDVIRIGYVENPNKFLNVADVLVLPSYREGFGTVVIEAAAMKIPTIGSDIYGLSDAIINNKTGLLHKKADRKDMMEKYEYILQNYSKIEELGNSAYSRVIDDFKDVDLSQELLNYILNIQKEIK